MTFRMNGGLGLGLGLVKLTSSFWRKRILLLNDMEFDSVNFAVATPAKKQCLEMKSVFACEKSLLEALPRELLIKILCGVDHEDLKRLFHVSKPIREAVMIVKECHFAYRTPKKFPAFGRSLNLEDVSSSDFEEIEAPNAPKQSRVSRSRLSRKNLAAISVTLFALSPSDKSKQENI